MTTKIEWATDSWNPITGCTPISEGCAHCYAKRMAKRLAGRYGYPADDSFRVTYHPDRLEAPWGWKKPRRVFVCSMGDLFHKDVQREHIDLVFSVMASTRHHIFMVLTKRPSRMKRYMESIERGDIGGAFPSPNVWLGVTCENQARADERIPILLQIPAAVRFVSIEPMLGPVDVSPYLRRVVKAPCSKWPDSEIEYGGLDWVIVGGETGPGARPMHSDWIRSVRDQCEAAGVPFFFKQWGDRIPMRPSMNGTVSFDGGKFVEKYCPKRRPKIQSGYELSNQGEFPSWMFTMRVGKKAAGRLLDGREWNEYPDLTSRKARKDEARHDQI